FSNKCNANQRHLTGAFLCLSHRSHLRSQTVGQCAERFHADISTRSDLEGIQQAFFGEPKGNAFTDTVIFSSVNQRAECWLWGSSYFFWFHCINLFIFMVKTMPPWLMRQLG
ncbi:MAG TPA: hypothetical protein PK244_07195, partial [Pseudomonadales bacterium]|nr:hypothetical protein [Pseudomonadales bacterium]